MMSSAMNGLRSFLKAHIYILAAIGFLLLLYWPVTQTYFQQDEWHNFGVQIYQLATRGGWLRFLDVISTPLVPVAQCFSFFNFYFFGIQNFFPSLVVLALVSINSFLFYKNVLSFTQSRFVAILSALLGYTSLIAHQSVTWAIPAILSQLSFFFLNLVIASYQKYLSTRHWKFLSQIGIFAVLGFLSKFSNIFIIPCLLCYHVCFEEETWQFISKKRKELTAIVFALMVLFFFIIRPDRDLGRINLNFAQFMLNIFILPLKGFSQIILINFHPSFFDEMAQYLSTERFHIVRSDTYNQTIVTELLSIIFSVLLILIFRFVLQKERRFYKALRFFAVFYGFSFLTFCIDIYSTNVGILESRYFNPAVFAVALLIALVALVVGERVENIKMHSRRKLLRAFCYLCLVGFILNNAWQIRQTISFTIASTQKKKEILTFIRDEVLKTAQNKFIIYIDDKGSTIPNYTGLFFQTGLLYPLLIYSYDHKQIDPGFFANDLIWDMTFQGVKTIGESKIGVFYNKKELASYVLLNEFPMDQIYSVTLDYTQPKILPNYRLFDHDVVKYSDSSIALRQELSAQKAELRLVKIQEGQELPIAATPVVGQGLYFVDQEKKESFFTMDGTCSIRTYIDDADRFSVGPHLEIDRASNGSDSYIFNKNLCGHKISFLASVFHGPDLLKTSSLVDEDSVEIRLRRPVREKEILHFIFALDGTTIVHKNNLANYAFVSQTLKIQGTGATTYKISLPGKLRGFPTPYEYGFGHRATVFTNKRTIQVSQIKGYETDELELVLAEKINKNEFFNVPVVYLPEAGQIKPVIFFGKN